MKLVPVIVLAAAPLLGAAPVEKAVAVLQSLGASGVSGKVTFTKAEGGVRVQAEISGLKEGPHGFHVHEFGDCSAVDGASAGGHFNPGGKPHGHHGMGEHHTGDLPSLKADASGVAAIHFESRTIRVGGSANDIVGKGLIVHRDPDDFTTQPTGNAGPRLACAVITAK